MSSRVIPLYCCFGGDFVTTEGKVHYVGGRAKVIHVHHDIGYLDLVSKVAFVCASPSTSSLQMKYKYPTFELDRNLVSIDSDEDVANMMIAFDGGTSSGPLELYIFPNAENSSPHFARSLQQEASEGDNVVSLANENFTAFPPNDGIPHSSHAELPNSNIALKEGLEFPDLAALKNAVCEHAICLSFRLNRLRSDPRRYTVRCASKGCSWRMHASKVGASSTFRIRSLEENHTCMPLQDTTHEQATIKWIANFIKAHLKENADYTISDIMKDIKTTYKIDISYNKAWRARNLASTEIQQNQSESASIRGGSIARQRKHLASKKKFHEDSSQSRNQILEKVPSEAPATEVGGQSQDLGRFENQQRTPSEMDHSRSERSDAFRDTDSVEMGSEDLSISIEDFYSGQFQKLEEYCKKILETNPGSVAKFSNTGKAFKLFVAYDASIHSHCQSRDIICIESVKSRALPYAVYFALGVDGKDERFPLSIGIDEAETQESCLWFCTEIASILNSTSTKKITILIDRRNSLLSAAINVIFPDAYLIYDRVYLISQFCEEKKITDITLADKLRSAIFSASTARTRKDFDKHMHAMKKKSNDAYEWLWNSNPNHWSYSHFEGDTAYFEYDFFDEFLGKISCVLGSPIISMMEEIRVKAANLYRERHQDSLKWETTLVPSKENILIGNEEWSKKFMVQMSSSTVFEIRSESDDNQYKVDLEKQTCSCACWQLDKIPCRHAVAALRHQNLDPWDYCHECYRVSQYKNTYSKSFHPVDKSVVVRHGKCKNFWCNVYKVNKPLRL